MPSPSSWSCNRSRICRRRSTGWSICRDVFKRRWRLSNACKNQSRYRKRGRKAKCLKRRGLPQAKLLLTMCRSGIGQRRRSSSRNCHLRLNKDRKLAYVAGRALASQLLRKRFRGWLSLKKAVSSLMVSILAKCSLRIYAGKSQSFHKTQRSSKALLSSILTQLISWRRIKLKKSYWKLVLMTFSIVG